MADQRKWKPWYARIPGAAVAAVGTMFFLPYAPMIVGLLLMEKGLDMMKRKAKISQMVKPFTRWTR